MVFHGKNETENSKNSTTCKQDSQHEKQDLDFSLNLEL